MNDYLKCCAWQISIAHQVMTALVVVHGVE